MTRCRKLLVPAWLQLPGGKSVIFKCTGEGRRQAVQAVQSIVLQLLASIPPGKLKILFVDPVGLGQNAAPFMHLADSDNKLITGKVWTQAPHIEQRLAALAEHMENVIQQYLRNQFTTIEEYNAHAGEIAEPYHLLVVFDFPENFSEEAARRVVSIVENGPRCGVYALIVADTRKPKPYGFKMADLEQHAEVLVWEKDRWVWNRPDGESVSIELDCPPQPESLNKIVTAVAESAKEAAKVEVPFARIAPPREKWWSHDSRRGIRAPLGLSGANRVQELVLGQGTSHHVLVAGRTGSGKSTLLHTIITGLALRYSPDELELYLIDFKTVEFKTYVTYKLPHARVVAIESEREFGLSVLQRLVAELHRRADLFRMENVTHISEYRDKTNLRLPRILLLIDEFHELFTEEDNIAHQAGQLLDNLIRMGRAFGIHILLASQTIAGTFPFLRGTVDQIGVRIALQCTENDSRLILAEDNPAARSLSRPGEAIYNDQTGAVAGNIRFQVARLPDETRDAYFRAIQELASRKWDYPPPQIVFEGNAPAFIEKNLALRDLVLARDWPRPGRSVCAWLGEPLEISDHLAAVFACDTAKNLLIVGQNDEAALGIMIAALVSLGAHYAPQDAEFFFFDFSSPENPFKQLIGGLANLLPHPIYPVGNRETASKIAEIHELLQRRLINESTSPEIYLFFYALQRSRDFQQDSSGGFFAFGDFSVGAGASPSVTQQLMAIVREGPARGIHSILWCDTVNNLFRRLERRVLPDLGMRVAFQMSSEDSATLIDTPAASRLGSHRALFWDSSNAKLQKFRPYSIPSQEWLTWIRDKFFEKVPASVARCHRNGTGSPEPFQS